MKTPREYRAMILDRVKKRLERMDFFEMATDKQRDDEFQLCARDYVHFINNWVWLFDPRLEEEYGLPTRIPLVMFPAQEAVVVEIGKKQSVHIDKTRDMGGTYICLSWIVADFVFAEGSIIKVCSAKENKVDDGTEDSLFGKMRFILRHLPSWMAPPLIKKRHDTYLKLHHPEKPRNYIIGESSNAGVGRSGRYKRVFCDEFAFMPFSKQALDSIEFTTKCYWVLSTPNGMNNEFARIKFDEKKTIKKLTLHWSGNPEKDQEWYEEEKKRIADPVRIAQELDCDYEASVEGLIYKDVFDRIAHVKNWKPLPNTKKIRMYDFGPSSDPSCCLWGELFFNNAGEQCLFIYRSFTDAEEKVTADVFGIEVVRKSPEKIYAEYGDPAGDNTESDGESFIQRMCGGANRFIRDNPEKYGDRSLMSVQYERYATYYRVMTVRAGFSKNRIFIHEDLTDVIDAICQYRKRVHKGERGQVEGRLEDFTPVHDWTTHFVDPLGYGVIGALRELRFGEAKGKLREQSDEGALTDGEWAGRLTAKSKKGLDPRHPEGFVQ